MNMKQRDVLVLQAFKFLFTFTSTILFARIVTPAEFGEFSVAISIIVLFEAARDFGLSIRLLISDQADVRESRQIAAISLLRSLLLGMLLIFFILIAAAFQFFTINIINNIILLCPLIPLVAISQILSTELWRRGKFYELYVTEIIGWIISVFSALVLTSRIDFEYLISIQLLSYNVILTSIRWKRRSADWYLAMKSISFRNLYTHPKHYGAQNLIRTVTVRIETILIANFLGVYLVGIFSRVYQFVSVPLQQIFDAQSSFAVSKILEGNQNSLGRWKTLDYIHSNLLVISLPIYVVSIAFPSELISFIFGSQWTSGEQPLRFLAISAIFLTLEYKFFWYFSALDIHKPIFRLVTLVSISRLLAILIGLNFGLTAIAFSIMISSLLSFSAYVFLFSKYFAGHLSKYDLTSLVMTILLNVVGIMAAKIIWTLLPKVDFLRFGLIYIFLFSVGLLINFKLRSRF